MSLPAIGSRLRLKRHPTTAGTVVAHLGRHVVMRMDLPGSPLWELNPDDLEPLL